MGKNMERVRLEGAKLDVDFIVVSKYVAKYEYDAFIGDYLPEESFPFEEGIDYSKFDENEDVYFQEEFTFFQAELIEYVYDVGPNIDMKWAVTLGLGVIQSLNDGSLCLYNADTADYDMRLQDEMLKLGMYYQITNPDYDDRQLDGILQTKGGINYLRTLLFCHSTDYDPIEALIDIFSTKKGKENNVVSIESKK